ncbi:MAG: inositol monophosphatase family protein [Candidatus Kapaibacterium sp.]
MYRIGCKNSKIYSLTGQFHGKLSRLPIGFRNFELIINVDYSGITIYNRKLSMESQHSPALSHFSDLTLLAIYAAQTAGNVLRTGFGSAFTISSKSERHDLVTDYDYRSEQAIISTIKATYPHHRFLAEESGATQDSSDESSVRWIIDPLDGTVNFAHTVPVFSVSIAAEVDGELFCGVIYQPMLDELFIAEKGKGAWLNGQQINVSATSKLSDSFLVTGFPYIVAENPSNCIDHFSRFLQLGIPIRRLGSAALDLAYTAAGRFDAFWEVSLSPWDVAAGILLVREAGGKVRDYSGEEYVMGNGPIIASNGLFDQEIVDVLR